MALLWILNCFWQIKICKCDLVWRRSWNLEIGNFWLPKPFFKTVVTLAGLNSLQQKGYQISVKNWIFYYPFHKKGPVLVVLVPGMIQPSGSGSVFWWNGAFEAVKASEVEKADEINEDAEVLGPEKSLLWFSDPLLISTDFLKYPFWHLFQTGIKFQL